MKYDPEGALIALGWDTESTSANRMRAIKGSDLNPVQDTGWKTNWAEVLVEVRRVSALPQRIYWQNHGSYQEAHGLKCTITLEPRPHYCDRGNFLAKLHPIGEFVYEIDGSDLWPRYYFDEERAKLEIEAWLQKRGQSPSPAHSL